MIDRKKFFDGWRLRFGKLGQGQVDTLGALIDELASQNVSDLRQMAYVMGSVHGEVGQALLPVREGFADGEAEARKYVAKLYAAKRIKANYALPDKATGKSYYGRGLIQLTHKSNYEKLGAVLGIDLVRNPDLALDLKIAARIAVIGMMRGSFTGARLADFFHGPVSDWTNARRIVNGMDRAGKFAELGIVYHEILREAWPVFETPAPPPPDVEPPPFDDSHSGNGLGYGIVIGLALLAVLALSVCILIFVKGN